MSIPKHYAPQGIESKWYQHWEAQGYFHSEPDDRPAYTIVIPPPNVTGVLHMGHVLNNTLQDVLVRRARMKGYNACWVPGTDHASIATEAKVVRKLRAEGLRKSEIGRDAFLEHAMAWKEEYGGVILNQLRKLGCSCDWERTRFTMEPDLSESVIDVFIDLYQKGYIYRGLRMVNWDPQALTAVSDEEVVHKETNGHLYHVRYDVEGLPEGITIATTRPETILGDTAICVHPEDERYAAVVGKMATVPLIGRQIPIIADDYVDREFGTGALKITPAHDTNDYDIGQRHQLESIDIFNPDGTLSDAAERYIGADRFDARKLIVKDLKAEGRLVKQEDLTHSVGYSERTDAVIEPRLSMQWFLDMSRLAGPALEHVDNGDIRFFPDKFRNVYRHWMENVQNWCISRQLWWGQRIPAWYYGDGEFVVAKTAEEALEKAKEASGNNTLQLADLHQDEDVVDTWFSSWLWPISVFDGIRNPENEEIKYYYPTAVLVTGWDIIFFWVARMIMAGYEYRNELPFKDVYFTGMVRDKQGRKMSKQLGNSPDPIDLIESFGADAVRTGMLFSSPAGGDLLYDEKLCEQGRNFNNKLWNVLRLVSGWEGNATSLSDTERLAIQGFRAGLARAQANLDAAFDDYRISEGLKELYSFVWDDFCSWYLEAMKPGDDGISKEALAAVMDDLTTVLRLLHPFMPFVTEEIYSQIKAPGSADLMMESWPETGEPDPTILDQWQLVKGVVSKVREVRAKQQMPGREPLDLMYDPSASMLQANAALIQKLAVVGNFTETNELPENAVSFVEQREKVYILLPDSTDPAAEAERIEKEIQYLKGFVQAVQKKLANANFVDRAPAEVVDREKQKLQDAQSKMELLEEGLAKNKMA